MVPIINSIEILPTSQKFAVIQLTVHRRYFLYFVQVNEGSCEMLDT